MGVLELEFKEISDTAFFVCFLVILTPALCDI